MSIALKIGRKRLVKAVDSYISDYIQRFLESMRQHPEAMMALLEKPAELLYQKFMKQATGEISGKAATQVGMGAAMKFVPKEMRGILALVQAFRGGGNTGQNETSSGNPLA